MFHVPKAGPPADPRQRSIKARRAARQAKAGRESRIVNFLNAGVSIAEIATREEVTEKRMRALVNEILARRMPEPPAPFLAMQVSRLNEALLIAYSAMSGGNLPAVDRVVKIVRELDRYHGFVAVERRYAPDAPRLEGSGQNRLKALSAPSIPERIVAPEGFGAADSPGMAPQRAEKTESALEHGVAPGELDPQYLRDARDPESRAETLRAPDAPPTSPETAPEAFERTGFAPGNEGRAPADGPSGDAFGSDVAARPEMAPEPPETIGFTPGNSAAREA